jgi:hypothetical protein
VEGDIPVNSEALLMINFVNIKIKSVQSFRNTLYGVLLLLVTDFVNLKIKSVQSFRVTHECRL